MKKQVRKIHIKILFWFLSIMTLSSILSFIMASLFAYPKVYNELKKTQLQFAQIVLTLSENDNLTTDEIIDRTSTPIYPVIKVSDLAMYKLSDEAMTELSDKKYFFNESERFNIKTFIKIRNDIAVIEINPKTNLYLSTFIRMGLTLVIAIFLGVLIFSLASKTMLKPIRSLIKATQEVARGNFLVRLEIKNNDEVSKLMENFNMMAKELGKIEIFRKDFISNVSHEFKTPVSSIHGFATLLQNTNLSNEQKEYTDIIVSESSRLAKLSSNVLSLSKLENQEMRIEKKSYYLDEQLRRCLLLLEKNIEEKSIRLEIHMEKTKYYGSEELLGQVWINLIENAVKYSKHSGKIIVRCVKKENSTVVTIKDEGVGMSEETQERIFEKFYQGDKTHSTEGNGLGLALVKRIIDIAGGSIEVESKLDSGSAFIVSLPNEE